MKITDETLAALKAKRTEARTRFDLAEVNLRALRDEIEAFPAGSELPTQFLVDLGAAYAENLRAKNNWEKVRSVCLLSEILVNRAGAIVQSGKPVKPRRATANEAERINAVLNS